MREPTRQLIGGEIRKDRLAETEHLIGKALKRDAFDALDPQILDHHSAGCARAASQRALIASAVSRLPSGLQPGGPAT